jgi:hypothetical protein
MKKIELSARRNFLKTTAIGAAGLMLNPAVEKAMAAAAAPTSPGPGNKWPGRVVINFNKAAVTGSGSSAKAATDVIIKMVNDAIIKLTGEAAIGAAWKAIFPSTLNATSKIAIKTCTYNSGLPAPHWSSVKAIADGLLLMDVGGAKFPASNITVYDMNDQTSHNLSDAGYTTDNFSNGINILVDTAVDGGDGALNNRTYAKTLKDAAFLINVFSPRGHMVPPEGSKFTLGFKSHYGTYSNPLGIHSNWDSNFREITCIGPVYNKLVLSVCSGIFGMNEGSGPTGAAQDYSTYAKSIDNTAASQCPTTIIMSTDPISAEMQAIKMMRINKGKKYTTADLPVYLRASGGIDGSALTPTYNIGTIEESQMDIRKIINASTPTRIHPLSSGNTVNVGISAHEIGGRGSVFMEFALPSDHAGKDAKIEIFNAQGSRVAVLSQKVLGVLNHLSWDKKDVRGKLVSRGRYVARLSSGLVRESTQFSIVG